MTEPPQEKPPETAPPSGPGMMFGLLVFGFGLAAGLLIAVAGTGVLEDSAGLILTVFLAALFVVALVGGAIILFRRTILRRLTGVAETQIESFAAPLGRVAKSTIARDPAGATDAARELIQLGLARYGWIATRRWIVTSLTALIAALAALAGTALLYRQNSLIEIQSALLAEQNDKIREQTALVRQDVELAEAARNAALAVEITNIAALIGGAASKVAEADAAAGQGAGVDPAAALVNVLDPVHDLDRALILRIVSASRAARPYRFLDPGLMPDDPNDKMRVAMATRRADLPQAYGRMAGAFGWREMPADAELIDRPASPERGQLLQALTFGGIRNLEMLNHFGLDLAFAYLPNAEFALLSAQGGRLSYADFSGSHIVESDLGGAWLENARFRRTTISRSDFSTVSADRARAPYPAANAPYATRAQGADFSGAVIRETTFAGAYLTAANFDGALLYQADFTDADLSAATLKGAVLIAPKFAGTALKSTDFDDAVLIGGGAFAAIQSGAADGTFDASRYEVVPLAWEEVMAIPIVFQTVTREEIEAVAGGDAPVRLKRVKAFEN
ncbi:MAG TPA: pentapeptide repeat-containing protein [Albidovulum sp.]|uniref:pentapeptide repeat-containing protein n=1 Tax=Albidovulum sp. TaxID=1872424 RepID=UPI002B685FE0|nr:pentapeptide repeat-containing protein [Albidovulum sp.]